MSTSASPAVKRRALPHPRAEQASTGLSLTTHGSAVRSPWNGAGEGSERGFVIVGLVKGEGGRAGLLLRREHEGGDDHVGVVVRVWSCDGLLRSSPQAAELGAGTSGRLDGKGMGPGAGGAQRGRHHFASAACAVTTAKIARRWHRDPVLAASAASYARGARESRSKRTTRNAATENDDDEAKRCALPMLLTYFPMRNL